MRNCPLCQTSIPLLDRESPQDPAYPPRHEDRFARSFRTESQTRWLVFGVLSAVLATLAIIAAGLDYFLTGGLSWAKPALASLALTEGLLAIAFGTRGLGKVCLGSAVLVGLFLAALSSFSLDVHAWLVTLGLPLDAGVFSAVWLVGAWLKRPGERGWDVFGFIFALVALFCLGLDLLLHHFLFGSWALGWSLIVVLGLVPPAGLFFFVHFGLRRPLNLRQLFHF
ncbi:MAG: hypothetical protein HKM06_09025 [Spirochaetales bacterium]|nr:hypothetical protein [Spirochaetales bacterium]